MLKKCEVLKGPQLDKAQSNSKEKKKIEKTTLGFSVKATQFIDTTVRVS